MVFYFTCEIVNPSYTLYMGEEKHENEELIRWGWPEDVWFHVDKGDTLDDVPQAVLEDCAQLVKANSIQGNKMNNVDVVYTMWENLKKTGSMEVGQVGFHKQKEVRSIRVEKRINEVVNRLNKTKVEEKTVDFRAKREERDAREREDQKAQQREKKKREKEAEEQKARDAELRSYTTLMKPENMQTNEQTKDEDSDDFM